MWKTHIEDSYVTTLGGSSGKIERVRLAYQYGVDGSVTEISELLANGIFVAETIDDFTDVENASERFNQISSSLTYDKKKMLWVLP
jgi:hypothetical protein